MESKITNTFLRELGLTEKAKLQLHNLASITTKEEEAGFDYFSLMRQNLFVLRIVLPRYE
jgi:ABC-type Zn uptake system ZnuABC Zn-binding protein ZnuA